MARFERWICTFPTHLFTSITDDSLVCSMHLLQNCSFWVLPLYLNDHGSSRYANYTVGKVSFIAFERAFDLQERARNHYAMLKHIFGYLRISPLFGVLRLDWRTLMGRGDTSTG